MGLYNIRPFFLAIICIFCLFIMDCGGGDSSTTQGGNDGSIVNKVIPPEGGVITHTSGLEVEFPDDSLSNATEITVEEVQIPSPLPDGISAKSKAFKISPEGLQLNEPAKITFKQLSEAPDNSDSIFKWDGNYWISMGSFFEEGNISTTTYSFSTFLYTEIIGSDLWKKFVFLNKGNDPANLMVWIANLYYPASVPPGSGSGSVSVPDASADNPERSLWLPLGCYQFCYDWMIYNPTEFKREMVHNFQGDAKWDYCLDDQTGLPDGESVWIDTTYGDYDNGCGTPPVAGGQSWQWQASGRGDYQACDVTNTMGSATPDPTLADEGLIAICWDGLTVCNPSFDCERYGAWCTYKDLSLDSCPAKEGTAYMYVAVPVSSEF